MAAQRGERTEQPLTSEQLETAQRMYRDGQPLEIISGDLGVGLQRLRRELKKAGVEIGLGGKRPAKYRDLTDDEARRAYAQYLAEGVPVTTIACRWGTVYLRLRDQWRRLGLPVRARGGAQQREDWSAERDRRCREATKRRIERYDEWRRLRLAQEPGSMG